MQGYDDWQYIFCCKLGVFCLICMIINNKGVFCEFGAKSFAFGKVVRYLMWNYLIFIDGY